MLGGVLHSSGRLSRPGMVATIGSRAALGRRCRRREEILVVERITEALDVFGVEGADELRELRRVERPEIDDRARAVGAWDVRRSTEA